MPHLCHDFSKTLSETGYVRCSLPLMIVACPLRTYWTLRQPSPTGLARNSRSLMPLGYTVTVRALLQYRISVQNASQIAKFMGPTWGPPGSCRPQVGPALAPWTFLSGYLKLAKFCLSITCCSVVKPFWNFVQSTAVSLPCSVKISKRFENRNWCSMH